MEMNGHTMFDSSNFVFSGYGHASISKFRTKRSNGLAGGEIFSSGGVIRASERSRDDIEKCK